MTKAELIAKLKKAAKLIKPGQVLEIMLSKADAEKIAGCEKKIPVRNPVYKGYKTFTHSRMKIIRKHLLNLLNNYYGKIPLNMDKINELSGAMLSGIKSGRPKEDIFLTKTDYIYLTELLKTKPEKMIKKGVVKNPGIKENKIIVEFNDLELTKLYEYFTGKDREKRSIFYNAWLNNSPKIEMTAKELVSIKKILNSNKSKKSYKKSSKKEKNDLDTPIFGYRFEDIQKAQRGEPLRSTLTPEILAKYRNNTRNQT